MRVHRRASAAQILFVWALAAGALIRTKVYNVPMTRHACLALFALAAVTPLIAQHPAGWKMRVDRSTSASDPDASGAIKFVKEGAGFHCTNPQAAVYWNPADTASGTYTVKGTFTLMKPSGHTNYYGLVFGGSGLEGGDQAYLYLEVAQNGTWLVKSRSGDTTPTITAKTPSETVKKPDDTGKSTNVLEVRVGADKVDFAVNGTVVVSVPKTGALAKTDGIYGIRINHLLEVQVDDFGVSK